MSTTTPASIEELTRVVGELSELLKRQQLELNALRAAQVQEVDRGRPSAPSPTAKMSRAGLLRVAGAGALAMTAAGLE